MANNPTNFVQINVKFLILKFGKLLLKQTAQQGKWALIEGSMNSHEDLYKAVQTEILNQSGWEIKNIRLFQINATTSIEVVFIVDAIKQTLQDNNKIIGLRWFQLNDLPKPKSLPANDADIIYAFAALVHPGKTLDLEHLPPVFNLKKPKGGGGAGEELPRLDLNSFPNFWQ
jgi:ADP-ribose pyrophosphatase YjhB (NUDIX family)